MPRKKIQGICSVDGCGGGLDSRGLCTTHYYRQWKFGRLEKINTGLKRKHPLYILWHDRKIKDYLVPEWLDFWTFVEAVKERPTPQHILMRLREGKFGPDNFIWVEHLRRRPDESRKDWWARKRRTRLANYPTMERRRDLARRFGLTEERADKLIADQNGKCAICGNEETSFEGRTGARKRLAIDHCHATGRIRALLCWRCNAALGKVEDSITLLEKMILYLRKHE